MNLLILMAGSSDAFKEAGFRFPKSLLEVQGSPAVEYVLESARTLTDAGVAPICVVDRSENQAFHIGDVLSLIVPGSIVVESHAATKGAACTALLAVDELDPDEPLLIFNGDQVLDADLAEIVAGFAEREADAGVVTFNSVHPRWSYVRTNKDGLVVEAAEKRPISRMATAGTYWFAKASDFVSAAERMISKGASVDGQYFVCPALNELVLTHSKIVVHEVSRENYHSLATPQGFAEFEELVTGRRQGPQ